MGQSATTSRTAYLEAIQRAGMEVYREPLSQAPVWTTCAAHRGAGSDLEAWFDSRDDVKDTREEIATTLWEQLVLAPMRRLVVENAPEISAAGNIIPFPSRAA
jgi:hypothetical protein